MGEFSSNRNFVKKAVKKDCDETCVNSLWKMMNGDREGQIW